MASSLALVLLAFVYPSYEHGEQVGDGVVRYSTSTLFESDGLVAVAILVVPAVLTGMTWLALRDRCVTGRGRGLVIGSGASLFLLMAALAGAASIGLFVLPVAVLLAAATALTPAGARPAGSG